MTNQEGIGVETITLRALARREIPGGGDVYGVEWGWADEDLQPWVECIHHITGDTYSSHLRAWVARWPECGDEPARVLRGDPRQYDLCNLCADESAHNLTEGN